MKSTQTTNLRRKWSVPTQRGALLFFLPPTNDQLDEDHWQAALADFASAFPLLSKAGFAVLGIVPEIDESSFQHEFDIPYPLIPFKTSGDLPCDLWKLVRDLKTCRYFRYAALLDWKSPKVVHEWRRFDPEKLAADVLNYLTRKKRLIYSPDSQLVRAFEKEHLQDRRSHAAEEGQENLQNSQPESASQGIAYAELMSADADRPAIGIAFSGGGIRSATFNLGVTQALARFRALPWVDYITSVSGGGFTAAGLVSLLSRRRPNQGPYYFNTQWERFPFNPTIEAFNARIDLDQDEENREDRNFRDVSYRPGHNTQLSYLLKKGNYLVPRLGLATRDLLRGVGTLLVGTGFTVLLFILAIFALACMHYFAASTITSAVLGGPDTTPLVQAASQETSSAEISLPYLLFGSSTENSPGEGPRARGTIPWAVYLAVFLGGALTAFFIYRFLTATYSYPLPRRRPPPIPEGSAEESDESEETEADTETIKPSPRRDPFFPQPHRFRGVLWLGLVLAAGGWVWTLGWPPALPPLSFWIYPLALVTAVLLFWLMLRGVSATGTVDRSPAVIWLLTILLVGGGVLLTLPAFQPNYAANPAAFSAWLWLPLAIVVFLSLLIAVTRKAHNIERWGGDGFDRWERYDPFMLRMFLACLLGVFLVALALTQKIAGPDFSGQIFWIWQPAVFFAGALAFLSLIRMLTRGVPVTWGSARFRTMIWAVVGMCFYATLAAGLLALLSLPHFLVVGGEGPGSPAVPLATAIISGVWAAFLSQISGNVGADESTLKKFFALPAGIRNFVLGVLVVLLWVSLIFLFESLLDRFVATPIQAFGVGLIALSLFAALGTFLNYNYLSPHYFFGDRAADVFMKTDVETPDGRVATVRDFTKADLKSISHPTSSAPYHLVVSAINLAGSGHLQDRDRKSRHFIFSREFVGSDVTGYTRTNQYRGGRTNYGSTIALSGAAASPGLGTFTFFAQAFMMALLNIRLGLWWVNPREYRDQSVAEADLTRRREYENRAFWPLYLLDEALTRTSERRRLVNLTDGGHTRDNGGLYPLFERRCKVILAGDASHDAAGLCHDLFSVLHYIRVDLDIHVEIDVSQLKPVKGSTNGLEAGMSAAHLAIGKIEYPAVYRLDGSTKHPQEHGWLIYVKPAVTKDLPAEVLQFWQTDKQMFPHPGTADQFFTERQFEAQRRLGEESIIISLQALLDSYRDSKSAVAFSKKDKVTLLENLLERKTIDYELLRSKPKLLDQMMQDWMDLTKG